MTNVILYIAMHGLQGLVDRIDDRFMLFNEVDKITDDFRRELVYRQKRAFYTKLNLCDVEKGLPFIKFNENGDCMLFLGLGDKEDPHNVA